MPKDVGSMGNSRHIPIFPSVFCARRSRCLRQWSRYNHSNLHVITHGHHRHLQVGACTYEWMDIYIFHRSLKFITSFHMHLYIYVGFLIHRIHTRHWHICAPCCSWSVRRMSLLLMQDWGQLYLCTSAFALLHFCQATRTLRSRSDRHNYANPVYGVATICHQVRWLRWGHPSLFHTATSLLIWYTMFCVRDISYKLQWMEFINMFSVYVQSWTHSRFNW